MDCLTKDTGEAPGSPPSFQPLSWRQEGKVASFLVPLTQDLKVKKTLGISLE